MCLCLCKNRPRHKTHTQRRVGKGNKKLALMLVTKIRAQQVRQQKSYHDPKKVNSNTKTEDKP